MALKFSPEIQAKIDANRAAFVEQQTKYANLNNESLIASAKLYMRNCVKPRHIEPGIPVYDSVMWHVVIPELIRRLERKE